MKVPIKLQASFTKNKKRLLLITLHQLKTMYGYLYSIFIPILLRVNYERKDEVRK